jgi:hypothetical protein
MAGKWQITGHSTKFPLDVTGTGTLQQSGNSVSGQVGLSGTPCALTARLAGMVSGTSFNFQLQEGVQLVSFAGVITSNGNAVSGTYMAPSGGCTNGDVGTWTANKV